MGNIPIKLGQINLSGLGDLIKPDVSFLILIPTAYQFMTFERGVLTAIKVTIVTYHERIMETRADLGSKYSNRPHAGNTPSMLG